jgi:Hereditary spastic paraplegia protein strumpellin
VESALYQSCLETLNYTVLHNLDEIRETAKRTYVERDDDLANLDNDTLNQSRMMTPQQLALRTEREKEADKKVKEMLKDITTCLENVGFVNPLNKVYRLVKELDYFPLAAAIFTLNALD